MFFSGPALPNPFVAVAPVRPGSRTHRRVAARQLAGRAPGPVANPCGGMPVYLFNPAQAPAAQVECGPCVSGYQYCHTQGSPRPFAQQCSAWYPSTRAVTVAPQVRVAPNPGRPLGTIPSGQPRAGRACVDHAECSPGQCIDGRCRYPRNLPPAARVLRNPATSFRADTPVPSPRMGTHCVPYCKKWSHPSSAGGQICLESGSRCFPMR